MSDPGPAHDPIQPYRQSHQRHGNQFKVTLWANERSQRLRFKVLAQLGRLAGKRVLDAGCSRGDFAAYLVEKGVEYERYIGVDALAEVVEFARSRNLPRTEFHAGDLLADPSLFKRGQPDVICVSGTLNTMTDAQAIRFLEGAWAATGEALIFNFLSGRPGRDAPVQYPPARRINPFLFLDWALSHTSNVTFRQDYFRAGHDATIMMRKTDPHSETS